MRLRHFIMKNIVLITMIVMMLLGTLLAIELTKSGYELQAKLIEAENSYKKRMSEQVTEANSKLLNLSKKLNIKNVEIKSKKNEIKSKNTEIIKLKRLIQDKEKQIKQLTKPVSIHSSKRNGGTVKYRDYLRRVASRGGFSSRKVKKVWFEVSMYTNAEGGKKKASDLGNMAGGGKTYDGVVAVPKSIPFGTEILIPHYESKMQQVFVAKDHGGAIKKKYKNGKLVYCIDVWTNSYNEAMNWGRRTVEGYIISK